MIKRYFLRRNNIITGPFSEALLKQMLLQKQLQPGDQLSEDKKVFLNAGKVLNAVIAPAGSAEKSHREESLLPPPAVCAADESAELPPPAPQLVIPPPAVMPVRQVFTPPPDEPAAVKPLEQRKVWPVISCILASMGNGSGYLQKLWQLGSGAMLGGGLLALFISIIFTLLGCILFSSDYASSDTAFYLRSMIFTVGCGCFFWLFNLLVRFLAAPSMRSYSNEADFLSAMHGAMNISLCGMIVNAVVCVVMHNLAQITGNALPVLICTAALFLLFIWSNMIVSFRINFMDGTRLSAGFATFWAVIELWSTLLLWWLLQKNLYIV